MPPIPDNTVSHWQLPNTGYELSLLGFKAGISEVISSLIAHFSFSVDFGKSAIHDSIFIC